MCSSFNNFYLNWFWHFICKGKETDINLYPLSLVSKLFLYIILLSRGEQGLLMFPFQLRWLGCCCLEESIHEFWNWVEKFHTELNYLFKFVNEFVHPNPYGTGNLDPIPPTQIQSSSSPPLTLIQFHQPIHLSSSPLKSWSAISPPPPPPTLKYSTYHIIFFKTRRKPIHNHLMIQNFWII